MVSQGLTAQLAGRYDFALAMARIRRGLWLMKGWPANSVRVYQKEDEVRDDAVKSLKELAEFDQKLSGMRSRSGELRSK